MARKLVWFSEIKWDYLRTRKQQVLSRFGDDWDVLFIEPYKAGGAQSWLPQRREHPRGGGLWVVTIPILKSPPAGAGGGIARALASPWVQGANQAVCRALFELWSRRLGFGRADRVIGLSNVYWGKIASTLKALGRFYDANDAHLDFPNTPPWAEGYLRAYVARADVSFAVSPEIASRLEELGALAPILLGNGVEMEHFAEPMAPVEDVRTAGGGRAAPARVLGYAGAMDWLDADLLALLARRFPDYRIVLVGPCIDPAWWSNQTELAGLANVVYLGPKPYDVLPSYVQQFDVCLIPFVQNELTRPLNPNKLYEYCATGRPVVSMAYSSTLERVRDVICVAHTADEFLAQVAEAARAGSEGEEAERRRALARDNSWDSIAARMQEEIFTAVGNAGHAGAPGRSS